MSETQFFTLVRIKQTGFNMPGQLFPPVSTLYAKLNQQWCQTSHLTLSKESVSKRLPSPLNSTKHKSIL